MSGSGKALTPKSVEAVREQRFNAEMTTTPTDCGTFAESNSDVKLPYGELSDGRIVHVSEVTSGAACGCVCPGCGTTLVARKGDLNEHHFAHQSVTDCRHALESALHKLAKEVLHDRREILLPEVRADTGGRSLVTHPAAVYRFDEAFLEPHLGDIVPDVIVQRGEHRLLVEMYVTHRCGPEKIERIRRAGSSCLEVDLSGISRQATREEVEDALLRSARRYWLNNPKLDLAALRLGSQIQRERLEAEEASRAAEQLEGRRLDGLAQTFSRLRAARTSVAGPPTKAMIAVTENGFGEHVGKVGEGQFCFRRSATEWQSCVVDHFVIRPLGLGIVGRFDFASADVLTHLRGRGLCAPAVPSFIAKEDEAKLVERLPWFRSPYQAVIAYLEYLEAEGVIHRVRKRWSVTDHAADEWADRVAIAQENQRRKVEVRRAVKAILRSLPEREIASFDLGHWWSLPHPTIGISLAEAFDHRDPRFAELANLVGRVEAMLLHDGAMVTDAVGLPIAAAVDREIVARQELAEAKRLEAEALSLKEGDERAKRLTTMAWQALGIEAGDWLVATASTLGSSPVASARMSEAGLAQARAALSLTVRQRDQKRAVERLRKRLLEIASGMPRPERARLILTSPNRDWRGQHPMTFCVDERSLAELRRWLVKVMHSATGRVAR